MRKHMKIEAALTETKALPTLISVGRTSLSQENAVEEAFRELDMTEQKVYGRDFALADTVAEQRAVLQEALARERRRDRANRNFISLGVLCGMIIAGFGAGFSSVSILSATFVIAALPVAGLIYVYLWARHEEKEERHTQKLAANS